MCFDRGLKLILSLGDRWHLCHSCVIVDWLKYNVAVCYWWDEVSIWPELNRGRQEGKRGQDVLWGRAKRATARRWTIINSLTFRGWPFIKHKTRDRKERWTGLVIWTEWSRKNTTDGILRGSGEGSDWYRSNWRNTRICVKVKPHKRNEREKHLKKLLE